MKTIQLLLLTGLCLLFFGIETNAQGPDFGWAYQLGATDDDRGYSIRVDASRNVYTAGRFKDTIDFDPGPGTFNMISNGGSDIFIQKIDESGNLVWARRMGGTNQDHGLAMDVDDFRNVLITGKFQGTADFDPGPDSLKLTVTGGDDIFIHKLNSSGDLDWVRQIGGPGVDRGRCITADHLGNVYTSGYFSDTVDLDPGMDSLIFISEGDRDIFIQKLDPDGNFVWARHIGGSGFDAGVSIATDTFGNVYTTGHFEDTTIFNIGMDTMGLISAGDRDIFIQKLDSLGNMVWLKQIGGTGEDNPYGIVLDEAGNIHSTGSFEETVDFDPGIDVFNLSAVGNSDIYVQKLDTLGNFDWVKQMGGSEEGSGRAIDIDKWGDIYLTGAFGGTIDFDPGTDTFDLTSNGSDDIFVQKISSQGGFIWANHSGGNSGDRGYGIAVDALLGSVYTTGYFQETVDFDSGISTFNLTAFGEEDIFQQKLTQCIVSAEINSENGFQICQGSTTNLSGGCGLNYLWSTGDTTQVILVSPLSTSNYSVTVSNSDNCEDVDFITITVNDLPEAAIFGDTEICEGDSASLNAIGGGSYAWSTGDSTAAITLIPTMTSFYSVTVTDNNGCTDTDNTTIEVESAPTAMFNYQTNVNVVDFSNFSSNANSFEWDFGDNLAGNTESNPTHTYADSGTYQVQLIAFGDCGSDTIVVEIELNFILPPEAALTLDNGTGCAPLVVQFFDDSEGEIDSWEWTFEGGMPDTSTEQDPQVIYNTPGTFDVTLKVTNTSGTNTITNENYITVNEPVLADFDFFVDDEGNVTFINNTQNATGFQWNFGDGNTSNDENPVHTYSQPGVYLVTLVVTNPNCGSAFSQTVYVLFTSTKTVDDESLIEIFPNPVQGLLHFQSEINIDHLQVYNILGQRILEIKDVKNSGEIDLKHLSSGNYIITFLNEDHIWSTAFIKQ